ncbi:hypothetical protein FB567DRAFT_525301 [Paraphoma chrysanthemicola]|uniref:ABM domain-containing protein n=1 Tax=Paraphoma chrysanthemicola TaxID=798071 RepID=A0A8K0R5U9_9PLEO|nr:hypothetical protein FB567DRAFT_525301 [Paraphoma chrysanthemicola]
MPVIEFGLMGVKPNHPVTSPSTPSGQILQSAWSQLSTAPNGPAWVYGGVEVSDPEKLWGFFEFESVEQHEQFARTFGGEAVKDLPKILTHSEFQKHITVQPGFGDVLSASETEILLVYFPADISDEQKNKATEALTGIIEESGLKEDAHVKAVKWGWSVENDFPVLGEKDRAGRVFAIFLGRESADVERGLQKGQEGVGYVGEFAGLDGVVTIVRRVVACIKFGE